MLFGETWTAENPDAIAYSSDNNPEDGLELNFIEGLDGRFKPVEIPGVSLGTFEVLLEGVSLDDRMYVYASTDNYKYGQGRGYEMGRSVLSVSDDDGRAFTYLYDFSTLTALLMQKMKGKLESDFSSSQSFAFRNRL